MELASTSPKRQQGTWRSSSLALLARVKQRISFATEHCNAARSAEMISKQNQSVSGQARSDSPRNTGTEEYEAGIPGIH